MTAIDHPTRPDLRRGRWLLIVAALAGAAVATVSILWLLVPRWNKFVADETPLLRIWLSPHQMAAVAAGLGLLGLIAAGGAAVQQRTGWLQSRWPGWLAVVGLVQGVGLVVGLSGITVFRSAGYVMAFSVPVAVLAVLVLLVWRGGKGRWFALAGVGLAVAVGIGSGAVTADAIGELLARSRGLPRELLVEHGIAFPLMAAGLAWILIAGYVLPLRRPAGWVLRHRTAITVVAALGPVPYAVIRLALLTPWWPAFLPGGEATPGIFRLFGVLISTGAWAGFVLTLGLLRPWSEVFPRWMPVLAGRRVPVWFAAVPGGFVATVLTAAAVPLLRDVSDADGFLDALGGLVIFPAWLWGPSLALAVWGYVLHRRSTDPAPPRIKG